jgi:hypothetical protein
MPPVGDAEMHAPSDAGAALSASFRFIPRELATKCRRLIESYHAIYGYVGLPDAVVVRRTRHHRA